MPSIAKITQNNINNVSRNFRIRKVKRFLPCDKIMKKLGKTIIYEMDLPNGKQKTVSYIKGRKNFESLSNGIRVITNFFNKKGNLIKKVKKFYTDNVVDFPYKEILIDKKNNSITTSFIDLNGKLRELTNKTGSQLSYAKFDGNKKLLYKDAKYMSDDGAINHDIYDPETNGKTLLKSVIKYFDGANEDIFYKNDNMNKSIFKEEIDDDVIKTEVRNFNAKEKLTKLSRSYSDTGDETIYDYIVGTDNVKKITMIDNDDGIITREEINYEGIFNATGGKIYENDELKYLTKYSFDDEITEAKTPDGIQVPLDWVVTYPKNSYLKKFNLNEWENLTQNDDRFMEMYTRISRRSN